MLDQLRQLLEISQLQNVTIRVVPYDAGVVPAGVNRMITASSSSSKTG